MRRFQQLAVLRLIVLTVAGALAAACGGYCATALALGLIAVNADFRADDPAVTIYVRSNGVHTDIVVPTTTSMHDWTGEIPRTSFSFAGQFISLGWGDRRFYLETPTWRDVRLSTALAAALGLGDAAMRIEPAGPPRSQNGDIAVALTRSQYGRLVEGLRASFRRRADGSLIPILAPSAGYSAYFEATGHYSLWRTCNDWTRELLTVAGVRMPVWSPFDIAILYQLRRIRPKPS